MPTCPVRRFTLGEYHRLIEIGILWSGDPYELIDGWIVRKSPKYPPHSSTVTRAYRRLDRLSGDAFAIRSQQPVSIAATASEPEPDVVVAVGPDGRYNRAHPAPRDVLLLVEVADIASLTWDRGVKLTAYARSKIPVYWIVNLEDRRVEVYTTPRGGRAPAYRTRTDYAPGDAVPVVVAGKSLGTIPVGELLP